MATIPEALAVALEHHQAGRLPEAEGIYRQILEVEPNQPDAQHLLGVIAHQVGRHDAAIEHIRRAIELKGDDPAFYNNLGEAYRARQITADAVACYRRALELSPDLADAHNNLGLALREQGQPAEAIACYRRALQLKPEFAEANSNLGLALQEAGQTEEAIAAYRRAVELKPDLAIAQNNLGAMLALRGQYTEAITCFQSALQTMPDYPDAHHNIGVALQDLGKVAEAVPWHERALQLKPDYPEAHNSLGNARQRAGKMDEAIACYRQALQLKPEYADAHNNMGLAMQNQGLVAEAIACYQQALQLNPDHADAHLNRSFAWLLTGDFERGWPEYEWRWKNKDALRRDFNLPAWDGRPLPEKTILLHAEQGLGDTIQFIRYAPLVKRLAGRVVVECQERLLPLFENCSGVDQWVGRGSSLPAFDAHAPLLSLPGLFQTLLENIPAEVPYVFAAPALVNQWHDRLRGLDGFRVGISWQGNPTYRTDYCRSIRLGQFAPLARIPGVSLLSLQKGVGAEQVGEVRDQFRVTDFSGELDERSGPFMDTAAIITNLSLVITSDSAIAHLAGALGVPVWVALPLMPDWRWLLDRSDSLWYPSMRLFRQKRFGEWSDVFERMAAELAATVGGDRSPLTPSARVDTSPICVLIAPGELLDKIAILEIKRARIFDAGKLQNIQLELEQLSAVRDRAVAASAELSTLSQRLIAVNEKLWDIEDHIRECEAKKDFGSRFISLARSVYITNDERSAIKRQINELLGSKLIEEKAYTPYGRQ